MEQHVAREYLTGNNIVSCNCEYLEMEFAIVEM